MDPVTLPPEPPKKRRRWGWLIVLVIIAGCTSAIAIPNLRLAMQRSKQKRTMADMRTLATALEARATDTNEYPTTRPVADLGVLLVPKYIKQVPALDGWGHPYRYSGGKDVYAITSAAADGKFEHGSLAEYKPGAVTKFDCDIVYSNGSFVQYPDSSG